MGGKNKRQVVGKAYRATWLAKIGHAIDGIFGIKVEDKDIIYLDNENPIEEKIAVPAGEYAFYKNNFFGADGGDFGGNVAVYTGASEQEPHLVYAAKYPLASGYPYESYCVFWGNSLENQEWQHPNHPSNMINTFRKVSRKSGFDIGNSGTQPEMKFRVKRTRVQSDNTEQWYKQRADGAIVCEVGSTYEVNEIVLDDYDLEVYFGVAENLETISYTASNKTFSHNKISGLGSGITSLTPDPLWSHTSIVTFVNTTNYTLKVRSVASAHDAKHSENSDIIEYIKPGQTYECVASAVGTSYDQESGKYTAGAVVDTYFLETLSTETIVKNGLDINPVHQLRELFISDLALKWPASRIDDDNFKKAADRLYDENIGISKRYENEKVSDLIDQICTHMLGAVRKDRQSGKVQIVLFRDDWFAEDEIHAIDKKYVANLKTQTTNVSKCINKLNVNWYDRENFIDSAFPAVNDAAVTAIGEEIADDIDLSWFSEFRNANIISNAILKQRSTPHYVGSFSTGWQGARAWNKYDLLRLVIDDELVLVRIMKISLGDGIFNNKTRVEFVEYVSIGSLTSTVNLPESEQFDRSIKACKFELFEVPFYNLVMLSTQRQVEDELAYNNEYGLLGALAEQPQSNSNSAILRVIRNGIEDVATLTYCTTAYIVLDLDRLTSTFMIYDASETILDVNEGTLIKCGEEWMSFVSFDVDTAMITVKRGVHSIPIEHSEDSILWICSNDIAVDSTEHVADQAVSAACLTVTPSAVQTFYLPTIVEFNAVAFRPYPPANVKINGEYWPNEISGDQLTLTWSHRNRVQQTSPTVMVGYFESSVTLETGVEYVIELYDENNALISTTNVGNVDSGIVDCSSVTTTKARIRLYSMRDGYASLKAFEHVLTIGFATPYGLVGTYDDVNNEVNLEWEFDE